MIAQRDALLSARVTYASDAEMAAAITAWNAGSPEQRRCAAVFWELPRPVSACRPEGYAPQNRRIYWPVRSRAFASRRLRGFNPSACPFGLRAKGSHRRS
jgi:hypothetical protein